MAVYDQSQQHAQTQTTLGNVTGAVLSGEFHGQVNVNMPPAPSAAAMRSIPAPPRDFMGRADDLRTLLAAFERGATITGVRGLGGIGKTALAYKLAESLASRYPDGNVFIPLYGVRPQPVAPDDALKTVLRAVLGEEARLPEGGDALGNCYRSALHGKRLLLLFDDAKDRAHVEPLLPPASCGVLITSRQKFALPGLQPHDLDALPPEDARALLLAICPRIGALADELARVCGGLPLALRAAGSALAERIDLSPAAYRRRLEQAQARLSLIDASLNLSYELLPPEQQARWALLAVFPADFDAAAVAAVWNMDADAAQDALSDLVKWSVVDFSISPSQEGKSAPDLGESGGGGGRYRLHDLARLFAAARAEAAARDAAELRHAQYYATLLHAANELYLQGGDNILTTLNRYLQAVLKTASGEQLYKQDCSNILTALKRFDTEWLNIQAGQAWAAAHAERDETATTLCNTYPDAGVYLLELRLPPRKRIPWLEAALAATRRLQDRRMEGVHLGNLGRAYNDLGEPRRAIEYFEQALLIDLEIGDRRGEGSGFGNLGCAYYFLGEPRRAIEYYEQQLTITREIGDRRGEGNALGNLGVAYKDLGEPRRAIEYHEQQLVIAREIGDRRNEGIALGNLGITYAIIDEPRRAIEYYEQDLAIAREIGDRRGEESVLGNLGVAYAIKGEPRRAIEYFGQELAISREIGDRRSEGNVLFKMSLALDQLGERARAIQLASAALAIFAQIEDPHTDMVRRKLAAWQAAQAETEK